MSKDEKSVSAVTQDPAATTEPNDLENALTEAELSLMRAKMSLDRWQSVSFAKVRSDRAQPADIVLLQIIGMNDRPKSVKELAVLTNRNDVPNIQYALRKLLRDQCVEKRGAGRTGVTYEVTARGRMLLDEVTALRQSLLVEEIRAIPGFPNKLSEVVQTLNKLSGLYDAACRMATAQQR